MKKLVLVFFLFFVSLFIGCDFFKPEPKEFTKSGITVTLDESFTENENALHMVTYVSLNVIFTGNRETITTNYTQKKYAELVLKAGNISGDVLEYSDDQISFAYSYYTNTVEDIEYKYLLVCMKGQTNKYYCMNFGTKESMFDDYKDQMFEWAKTIKVE